MNDNEAKEREPLGLKKLRLKRGLSQTDLAARFGVAKTLVSQWERGWESADDKTVKELAVLFQTSADDVLGKAIPVEEWADSPFAIQEAGEELFGTIRLKFRQGDELDYPLSHRARESLLSQLSKLESLRGRSDSRPWLVPWTLNNLMLVINPARLRELTIIHDDEEASPAYVHPQAYREIESWDYDRGDIGPMLQQEIDRLIDLHNGDEPAAIRSATETRVVFEDGTESWYLIEDGWDTLDLGSIEAGSFDIPANSFAALSAQFYRHAFINLDHTNLIEIPLQRFHRMSAPD